MASKFTVLYSLFPPKKAWMGLNSIITIYNVEFIWNLFDMPTYLDYFSVMNLCWTDGKWGGICTAAAPLSLWSLLFKMYPLSQNQQKLLQLFPGEKSIHCFSGYNCLQRVGEILTMLRCCYVNNQGSRRILASWEKNLWQHTGTLLCSSLGMEKKKTWNYIPSKLTSVLWRKQIHLWL